MVHVDDWDKIRGSQEIKAIFDANHEANPMPAMVDAGTEYGWRRQDGQDHERAMMGCRAVVESWYGLHERPSDGPRVFIGDPEKNELAGAVVAAVESGEQHDLYAALFDAGCRFGQVVQETGSIAMAFRHVGGWLETYYGVSNPWGPGPVEPGNVRKISGLVRIIDGVSHHPQVRSKTFADDGGPMILHGCSDFAAIVKWHQDRDHVLRDLDYMSQHVQYVRVLWRLNGWHWSGEPRYANANLSVDPKRDSWYDEALRQYLEACRDRGLRVNLSTGDMNNWSRAEMEDGFRRTAQIAASVGPEIVWLGAAANELRGTMNGGASDANLRVCEDMMRIWEQHYPWSQRAITDDGQDKAGMKRASGGNATVALIHNVRWANSDALRRAFNTIYENDPGKPVVEDEPTGPNGSPPHTEFTRKVWQPTEDHTELLALYTMHVIVGMASTYFSDPALVSRQPMDSTWGLREIPEFWRQMGIPQDIGQGTLKPGHHGDAPLRINNGRVTAGRSGTATAWRGEGVVWERHVNPGDEIVDSGAERADSTVKGGYSIGVVSGRGRQPLVVRIVE